MYRLPDVHKGNRQTLKDVVEKYKNNVKTIWICDEKIDKKYDLTYENVYKKIDPDTKVVQYFFEPSSCLCIMCKL